MDTEQSKPGQKKTGNLVYVADLAGNCEDRALPEPTGLAWMWADNWLSRELTPFSQTNDADFHKLFQPVTMREDAL